MKHSTWELIVRSAGQGISCLLWNPKRRYHVHKNPLLVRIPSQMNPIHTLQLYVPTMHFNIILSSTPKSLNIFPTGSPTKILYVFLVSLVRSTCTARLTLLDFIICDPKQWNRVTILKPRPQTTATVLYKSHRPARPLHTCAQAVGLHQARHHRAEAATRLFNKS
jgi:hypothetical protein